MARLTAAKLLAIVTGASSGIGRHTPGNAPNRASVRRSPPTQQVGRGMRSSSSSRGRILITGSIAGFMPGSFQAVYNGTKAFIDSFSFALRNELKDCGVTVPCLMPGATDTEFFERAKMQDTKVRQQKKDDPAMVAEVGFAAMMRGDGDVVAGWKNKLQTAMASMMPSGMLAEQHRKMTEPGSGSHRPRAGGSAMVTTLRYRSR